jgi:hypothetical protein
VFAVVNDGGHTDAEITKVRAVFADTDGAPLEPIVEALPPHCVIASSPGKFHVYWFVEEGFPLDQFKAIQRAIARKFGTDIKVSNLSRVMRVPGFAHNKGDPFDVHFVEQHLKPYLPRYSLDEIVQGLGLQLDQSAPERKPDAFGGPIAHQPFGAHPHHLSEAEEMLKFIDPWCDRDAWMKVLFAVASEFGEAGRELVVRWSRGDLWPAARMGSNL